MEGFEKLIERLLDEEARSYDKRLAEVNGIVIDWREEENVPQKIVRSAGKKTPRDSKIERLKVVSDHFFE